MRRTITGLLVAFVGWGVAEGRAWSADDSAAPAAKQAIEPAAPVLPGEIVAAMQNGKYNDVVVALNKLASDPKAGPDEKAYYSLITGIAHRLNSKLDAAREALASALKTAPKNKWAAKLRSELAVVELAAKRYSEAEELARSEATSLLDGARKDRLAEVYQTFARRLLKPDEPIIPPDPEGAYALLTQARNLAKGEKLRADLLFAMGQASQAANNFARAAQDFTNYLHEFPSGADRPKARYELGVSQFRQGQALPARLTWTDLARDLEKSDSKDDQQVRARAMFDIGAASYAMPNPPDDAHLNLGVAALRRYLAAYPGDNLAVRAAYYIGAAYQGRGKSQDAYVAYLAFLKGDGFQATTDEAKRILAELSMTVQFQVGQVLQQQEKFAEAIDAFKSYLAKNPNGPQSADAQRAILDTQLLIAADLLRREKFADARAAWAAFAAQSPLDGRVPQVLFQIGESYVLQERHEHPDKVVANPPEAAPVPVPCGPAPAAEAPAADPETSNFDKAIAAWELLAGKFPGSEPAAHGQFYVAWLFETEKGDPSEAIERYKKVAVEPWASQAKQRIAVMETKALTVVTPRGFRSGETAHLKINTRNLDKLTFTAYRLDPEAYFRKKHTVRGVESLDIALVQPDAEWTADVPGYGKYKPIETTFDLKKLTLPGVYVVKVSDEKFLQATTLVLGSDLDAIVKTSRDQILVFAQDMKTGEGRAGARVLVSDGSGALFESKTGKDGVLLESWKQPRNPNTPLQYLVLDGGDVCGSGLAIPGAVAQGLTARAYLSTDRPAYRPGQDVQLRGVVREVADGQYANVPKAAYKLEVSDSRGRMIVKRDVTLTDFGTFATTIALDGSAPVGSYRVRLYQPGKSEFAGQFEVQAYQLQKIDLAIELPRSVYFRGEKVEFDVVAKYQYGSPLANHQVAVQLPDGRRIDGQTGADGKFHVEMATDGFAEEQILRIVAQLPQDNLAAAAAIALAVRAFNINLATTRDVFLDGEKFTLRTTTISAQGEPTGEKLTVAVLKRVTVAGRAAEREVAKETVETDAKTGRGSVDLKVDDADGGQFILRASASDRFGNAVVADRDVTISGKKDETKLRMLADRTSFKVGETAKVTLHSRSKPGPALLAWEADKILQYKLISLKEGENALEWPIEGNQFPNFTLTAARMDESKFHQARIDLRIERDLKVTIKPLKETVGPGDDVEVEVTTADQLGRPVAAEIAIALVDQALLRLFGDRQTPIESFFYSQTRTGAFATEATNTFKYEPATIPVEQAVVEDQEQQVALALADADRKKAGAELKDAAGRFALPAPDAPPRAGGMMGGGRDEFRRAQAARGGEMFGKTQGMAAGTVFYDAPKYAADALTVSDGGIEARLRVAADESVQALRELGAVGEKLGAGESEHAEAAKSEVMAKRRVMASKSGVAKPNAAAAPRQRFVETAYWNPSVVTDKDGRARVTFKAPTALSRYRFSAKGVSGNDTLVGQAGADLAVKQDFFVDLKTPATLTQGDKPRFQVQLHHRGVAGAASLALSVYAGGRQQVYPKNLEIKGDGVENVLFEPFEVPDGENARIMLNAKAGDASDEVTVEIPIRPWGVEAVASASGSAKDDATVFVGLPPGREYDQPELVIALSPTMRRMIVELALGHDAYPIFRELDRCLPIPPNTTADRASELIAASAALNYLQTTKAPDAPEASRIVERIRGVVAELISAQNEDGGWPWVTGSTPGQRPSDRLSSARALFALATAEDRGLLSDVGVADKGVAYLAGELAKLDGGDHETRAAIVHALSTRGKATFEQANALNRIRQSLPDVALAYLALTFSNLSRQELAGEVLGILGPRAKTEEAGPGLLPRRYWDGGKQTPWHRSAAETTGLAALAFSRARPEEPVLAGAIAWLEAHRIGAGWQPHKAKGAILAALGNYYAKAQADQDRYSLVVTVNDTEVHRGDVAGATESKIVRVPRKILKPGDKNRVHFDIEGRGTFGYAVTLTGFTRDFRADQDAHGKTFGIHRRVYWPAWPTLDGKVLPQGFSVAVNPKTFENTATMVALGGRATIGVDCWRSQPDGQPAWDREFLVLEEHLPAGTTLVEGSVESNASHHEYADGVLSVYFAPDQYPNLKYDVFGFLPGEYKALPARLRSAYEPGRQHLSSDATFKVLAPDEPNTDPRQAPPDELYARGKAHFDAGRLTAAAESLEALWGAYTLRDDIAKDAARMLLKIHIKNYNPRKIVDYFEVLKQKAPELVIPFDEILVVGRAYADIGENERAFLVWRATSEASYLEDAQVGQVLRQRGKSLEGIAYLINLWREYPSIASIQSDFFGLSQVLASKATVAVSDANVRRELAAAGVSKTELLAQSIRLVQVFLVQAPRDPLADEASLALVGSFLELEDFESVVKLARRFAELFPKSTFLDSFQYSEALGRFHLGEYDRAIAVAETIASATYKDANGVDKESPNKWQAVYILGQIHDARRQPAKAIGYYEKVADRFTDAAGAIAALKRKDLKLPEVAVVRPAAAALVQEAPKPEPGVGFRNLGAGGPIPVEDKPVAKLDYRNIASADVKVYPVDLMRLYLTRRNLNTISGIDLAGIKPLFETSVKLGEGSDYDDKARAIDLPLQKEGAYLVMVRGDELYASGILLMSPLEIEVLEEPVSGRVRVTVRDARTKEFAPKVQVKVIGSANGSFFSGQTDLRGVFVAEGLRGAVTAVARKGSNQYAFYRGTTHLGPPANQPNAPATTAPQPPAQQQGQSLDDNLKGQNFGNQMRQLERLQNRYSEPGKGVQVDKAR